MRLPEIPNFPILKDFGLLLIGQVIAEIEKQVRGLNGAFEKRLRGVGRRIWRKIGGTSGHWTEGKLWKADSRRARTAPCNSDEKRGLFGRVHRMAHSAVRYGVF
jgi:hypothetical protein